MADIFTADEVIELARQIDCYIDHEIRVIDNMPPIDIRERGETEIKRHLAVSRSSDAALKNLTTIVGPYGDYDNRRFLFKKSLSEMPKFVNDKSMKKVIALWRLSVGK